MAERIIHSPIKAGDVFTRWTVVGRAPDGILRSGQKRSMWHCRCECKTERPVDAATLLKGASRSCGCLARELRAAANFVHGAMIGRRPTAEYTALRAIMDRCLNPRADNYAHYGGRGITVCDRWLHGEGGMTGFQCFLADMGTKPTPRHSVERPDNDGPYAPWNCRWATKSEQARNTRANRWLTLGDKTLTLTDWAAELGMTPGSLHERLSAGWSLERALTTPPRRWA